MLRTLRNSNQHLKTAVKVISASYSSTNPQKLPYLPVPRLQDTLYKFLDTAQPHLTPDRFENTRNVVREFGKDGGVGEKLQQLLEKRAESKENWLSDPTSDWWLNCAYLQYREPLVVWSSAAGVYPKRKFVTLDDKIRYAAQVVHAALLFKSLIDRKMIPVENMGKHELDMQQYNNIFGTCRIPGEQADSLEFHPNSKHISIAVGDFFFKVAVYSQDGSILGENQLQDQIRECITVADKQSNPVRVGVLTSDNRDNWAKAYEVLMKDVVNRQSVSEIQQSLFVLALDREMPLIDDDTTTSMHALITGAGSKFNSANRWFDKAVQFVIGSSGTSGLNHEHSPAEGGPMSVLSEFIINNAKDRDAGIVQPINGTRRYEKPILLEFQSSPQLEEKINLSSQSIDKLAADTDLGYLHFTDFGKNFIKSQKLSPDSFIQMAIQFAFYRLHLTPGAQYESAGTRVFVHGRTDVIRSCSNESIAFSKAMVKSKDDQEKLQKLKASIEGHKKYVNLAVRGQAIDRHLLGLKLIAAENGLAVPELFSDEGYVKSSTYRLSTSQVASVHDTFMFTGPLTYDGYGCYYSPRNDDIYFGLSSMRSNCATSTATFRKSLKEAFQLMQQLLQKVGERPIKDKL